MPNHLQQIEQMLRDLIKCNDTEGLVAWVKERVLESYRNGLARVGRKERSGGGRPAGSGITK